jgi:sec-independent protein translocase protein TatC
VDEKRLPFIEHLDELRVRITRCLQGLLVAVVGCFLVSEQIFDFVAAPLVSAFKEAPTLHIQSPMEVFFVYLKLSLIAGIVVAAPWILYQLWMFVAPGLYRTERRLAVAFVFFGTLFFFGGVAFAYKVVFPYGFQYLLDFAYDRAGNLSLIDEIGKVFGMELDHAKAGILKAAIKPTIMMETYVGLVLKLLLAFGLVFELPLLLYFLAKVGLVNHRSLLRFFRYWVVLAFLISAILTPPDVFTQTAMAGPLIIMYLMGVVVAWMISRKREAKERKLARELGYDDDGEAEAGAEAGAEAEAEAEGGEEERDEKDEKKKGGEG